MVVPQCHLILKWRAYIAICTMCVICTCIMLLLHLISPIVLLHIHVVLVKAYWCMCGFPNPKCWIYCMQAPAHVKNMHPVACSAICTMCAICACIMHLLHHNRTHALLHFHVHCTTALQLHCYCTALVLH